MGATLLVPQTLGPQVQEIQYYAVPVTMQQKKEKNKTVLPMLELDLHWKNDPFGTNKGTKLGHAQKRNREDITSQSEELISLANNGYSSKTSSLANNGYSSKTSSLQ